MHISAGVGEFRSVTIGAESFSEEIIERIDAAGLLDDNQWMDVEHVAVHPDNREKAMVVPVDAHQLLKAISGNGWSWTKWNALASEVPPTDECCYSSVAVARGYSDAWS